MAYTDLTDEERILLAVEFVGRGAGIPAAIADTLEPNLLADILLPETRNDRTTRTDHAPDS
jgi:hypothetical protein